VRASHCIMCAAIFAAFSFNFWIAIAPPCHRPPWRDCQRYRCRIARSPRVTVNYGNRRLDPTQLISAAAFAQNEVSCPCPCGDAPVITVTLPVGLDADGGALPSAGRHGPAMGPTRQISTSLEHANAHQLFLACGLWLAQRGVIDNLRDSGPGERSFIIAAMSSLPVSVAV
jgi:hypothetical protein